MAMAEANFNATLSTLTLETFEAQILSTFLKSKV
jgi:hypothetical protein